MVSESMDGIVMLTALEKLFHEKLPQTLSSQAVTTNSYLALILDLEYLRTYLLLYSPIRLFH